MLVPNKKPMTAECVGIGHNLSEYFFGERLRVRLSTGDDYPKFKLYKYLRSEDLTYFLEDEVLRIAGAYSYGDLVDLTGVGDPKETDLGQLSTHIKDSQSPAYKRSVDNLNAGSLIGIFPDPISGIGPKDVTISIKGPPNPNYQILCFAERYSNKAMKLWKKTPDARYDACIEISDAVEFIRKIQAADEKGERRFGGHAIIDRVQYVQFPLDLNKIDLTYYTTLKDVDSFGWQDEIRVSWPSEAKRDGSPYFLKVPGISKLFSRVS